MQVENKKKYKAYIVRRQRETINPFCDFFLTMFFIFGSAFLLSMIFIMLHQHKMDEMITESLELVDTLDTKILRVKGGRAEVERMICEIREDLAKVYELINDSAGGKYPLKESHGTPNVIDCKELALRPNSNITSFACEIAHINGRICDKFLKDYRVSQKTPPKEETLEASVSESSLLLRSRRDASNATDHQNKTRNQNGKSSTYPKRIRRAADSEETTDADEFWANYAGDPQTSCKVPRQGLKSAEILCKVWPQSIACNTYCVYGSTYPEGIMRTLNCSYHKNRWSDYFEDCLPFVNCKLRLVGPGTLKCIGNKVNQSPSCYIGCEDYEDNEGTPAQMYECKADGTWAPALPPCVIKKTGVDLVKAPDVLEHKVIEFPKKDNPK